MTIENIISIVCNEFGINKSDIKAKGKQQKFTDARHFAVYFIREIKNAKFRYIGLFFNGRDHTSMIYSYNKVCSEYYKYDVKLNTCFTNLKNVFNDKSCIPIYKEKKPRQIVWTDEKLKYLKANSQKLELSELADYLKTTEKRVLFKIRDLRLKRKSKKDKTLKLQNEINRIDGQIEVLRAKKTILLKEIKKISQKQ